MNEEKKVPLYSFYGKDYDYNELLRAADSGLNEYILGIRKGKKNYDAFVDAYNNLMAGIKDGTITFTDGHYHDSLGRYTNLEGKTHKDYYGLMANYIYNLLLKGNEYVAPENLKSAVVETAKTPEPTVVGEDLEEEVPEQAKIKSPVEWLMEYSPRFKGLLMQQTYTLSSLAPEQGILFNKAVESFSDKGLLRVLKSIMSDNTYDINNEAALMYLFEDVFPSISNDNGLYAVLNMMQQRDLLELITPDNPNLLYIPGTESTSRNTGWVWNKEKNILQETDLNDIPSWVTKNISAYNAYLKSNGVSFTPDDYDYYSKRYKFKKGGILKALEGTSLPWYSNIRPFDPKNYKTEYDTSKLYSGLLSDLTKADEFKAYESKNAGIGIGRYAPTATLLHPTSGTDVAKQVESNPYYQKFSADLLDAEGNFTKMGEEWAHGTDALLPKGSLASFYDENGKLRTSWTTKNNDALGGAPRTFDNLKDYVNYVRTDSILGGRHNVYSSKGTRYFYKDAKGEIHYVNPDDIGNYIVGDTPIKNIEGTTEWTDYELTGLKSPETPETPAGSDVKRKLLEELKVKDEEARQQRILAYRRIIPGLMDAGRLYASLHTNNRVRDTLRPSLKPVLKDTYELYSPITGAFGEMQERNLQAAALRHWGSTAGGSDASLEAAKQLDSNLKATELEHQGFLADNKEIKRTLDEALKRLEDNIRRRSDVSNFNRASINQTNRELAQLEATRLKLNWQSVDNYMKKLENRYRSKVDSDKEKYDNFRLLTATNDIENQYKDAIRKAQEYKINWDKLNPDGDFTKDAQYKNYIDFLTEMGKWKTDLTYALYAKILGYPYKSTFTSTPEQLKTLYKFKNGGRINSISLLINKVIKENQ